jgi:Na+(H+)/acetate symporter ActP
VHQSFIFATVKTRRNSILISLMFICIFLIKMTISVAPVFLMLNNKTVNAVIMQLELEAKDEKDAAEKDLMKDKKFFDEDIVFHCYALTPILIENNILHNQEHALFLQTYHPVVPTPPPNA